MRSQPSPVDRRGDLGVGIGLGGEGQQRDVVARPCYGQLGIFVSRYYQSAVVDPDHCRRACPAALFNPRRSINYFSDHRGGGRAG